MVKGNGVKTRNKQHFGDMIAVFDNNQVLQRRWKILIGNKSKASVITIVMFIHLQREVIITLLYYMLNIITFQFYQLY